MKRAGHLPKDLPTAFTATRGTAGQGSSAARSKQQAPSRTTSGSLPGLSRSPFQSASQLEGWQVPELWGAANAVAAACRRSFSGAIPDVACRVNSQRPLLTSGSAASKHTKYSKTLPRPRRSVLLLLQAPEATAATLNRPAEGSEGLESLLDFEARVSPSQVC